LKNPSGTSTVPISSLTNGKFKDMLAIETHGRIGLDASLNAKAKALGSFAYKAHVGAHFEPNNQLVVDKDEFEAPKARKLLGSAVDQFFATMGDQPLGNKILAIANKKLPIVGKSVAEMVRFDDALKVIVKKVKLVEEDFTKAQQLLEKEIPGLKIVFRESDVPNLLRGKSIDILHFDYVNTKTWSHDLLKERIFKLGIPGLASASLDVALGVSASLKWHLSMGLDTAGVWIADKSGVDLRFDATGTASAKMKVLFGLAGVKANGSATMFAEMDLLVKLPPEMNGKLRLDRASEILKYIDTQLKGGAAIDLSAKVRFLFIKKTWHWSKTWNFF
jgi:hypothetical protein